MTSKRDIAGRDLRALIELYFDGEIDDDDRALVEQRLTDDESARGYLAALKEAQLAVRLPVEDAAESMSFDGLFSRIQAELGTESLARDGEVEMLAMAWADGELSNEAEVSRVQAYLDRQPAARAGIAAISEIGELARMPIEIAADSVDFDALARRIDVAVQAEGAAAAPTRAAASSAAPAAELGLWARLSEWLGVNRGAFAMAAVAAAACLVMLPFAIRGAGSGGPQQVINVYEAPMVDSVSYDQGFYGAITPGDDMVAPVVWIAEDDVLEAPPGGAGGI